MSEYVILGFGETLINIFNHDLIFIDVIEKIIYRLINNDQ